MVADPNKLARYPKNPILGRAILTAANAVNPRTDGAGVIGTSMAFVYKAGSNNGAPDRLVFNAAFTGDGSVGHTPPITTTLTTATIYFSTKDAGATTSADTTPYRQLSLPAFSAGNTTQAVGALEVTLPPLPADTTILVSMALAPTADSAWSILCVGADY